MPNLYVIRHGETEWNVQKRMQGRLDSSLTEKGRYNAELLGRSLKDIEFKRIFSSPSKRATDTAKLVRGNRDLPIEEDERLFEIHLGEWQGKTHAEIKTQFPKSFDAYWNRPEEFVNPHGEVFQDVKDRVADFLAEIERFKGNILIVTHGVVIKALYLHCRNTSVREIWNTPEILGTSLTIVSVQDGLYEFTLEGSMDHCRTSLVT